MEITICPILTELCNLSFELPKKTDNNLFLFTPVRYEYLLKIDGKKHTFETIGEMQDYIYSSNHEKYSFRGIIFYCGFFVESKFACEPILDLNREVKYILHSDTINCKTPSEANKRVFTKRIRDWNENQSFEYTPIWCDIEDFKLKPIEIIGEIISVTNPEMKAELERLENLPQDEGKLTFFAKIRKMFGI